MYILAIITPPPSPLLALYVQVNLSIATVSDYEPEL